MGIFLSHKLVIFPSAVLFMIKRSISIHPQEKKANKKKKKGVTPGGGMKANMKDNLVDYGAFDGGYGNEYDEFM